MGMPGAAGFSAAAPARQAEAIRATTKLERGTHVIAPFSIGELDSRLWTTRITDLDVHLVIPLGLAPGSRTIPHLDRSDKQLAIGAADRQFHGAVIGRAAQDEVRFLVWQLRCTDGWYQACQ